MTKDEKLIKNIVLFVVIFAITIAVAPYTPFLPPNYIVREGDTIESIASRYNKNWQIIALQNGFDATKPIVLIPGQKIKIYYL